MADDLDGFIFNVEKWFGSIAQQRMSFAEKGVYLVMMFQQWRDRQRSLPDDPKAVADLIAGTTAQVEEVLAAWEVVRRKFVTSKHSPGRIYNVAIEKTRRKQRAARRKLSERARTAGKASAAKRQTGKELDVNVSSTQVELESTGRGVGGVRGVVGEKKNTLRARARGSRWPIHGTGCPHTPVCQRNKECIDRCIAEGRAEREAS